MITIKPIMKYPGGKASELKIIKEFQPKVIENYIEPFVGGGAVFFDTISTNKTYINDSSKELMLYYKALKTQDAEFLIFLEKVNAIWIEINGIITKERNTIINKYKYCSNEDLADYIFSTFLYKSNLFLYFHDNYGNNIFSTEYKCLIDKLRRTRNIAKKNNGINDQDIVDNIESGLKSGVYTYIRNLFNNYEHLNINNSVFAALYFFIREYSYSSMFRYNKNGDFNVPYGGISYNKKTLTNKISAIKSNELSQKMKNTSLHNQDFEEFLKSLTLKPNDFIFLDPPYDSDFSTYSNNEFGLEDHRRLRNFCRSTEAKFLLIIKNTEYIYNLYKDFFIFSFDKKYSVSFMNRNNRNVNHLLITNYKL